jgi:hypothetical protein
LCPQALFVWHVGAHISCWQHFFCLCLQVYDFLNSERTVFAVRLITFFSNRGHTPD